MHRIFLVVIFLAINAFPQDSVSISGLKANVTVQRDKYSRPYISAANDADLYFVQGYVTASDRLWQMDMMRRVARGETAELSGQRTLEEDKRWRRFGFAKVVEESIQYLTPELRTALESYAAGVNAYIASLTDETMPVEFTLPPEVVAELEKELKKEIPNGRIAGPVPLMQAVTDGEDGLGAFQVVSAVLSDQG